MHASFSSLYAAYPVLHMPDLPNVLHVPYPVLHYVAYPVVHTEILCGLHSAPYVPCPLLFM